MGVDLLGLTPGFPAEAANAPGGIVAVVPTATAAQASTGPEKENGERGLSQGASLNRQGLCEGIAGSPEGHGTQVARSPGDYGVRGWGLRSMGLHSWICVGVIGVICRAWIVFEETMRLLF